MPVQISSNNANVPFILKGTSYTRESATIAQDAGRTAVLAFGTLLAKVAATGKLTPFIDETATNGTARPYGIYIGEEIAAADLVAGDVENVPVLAGGACTIDAQQLVIENSKLLTTIIGATSVNAVTVQDVLRELGIYVESTVDIDEYENA